jgi:hypothetical protein
MPGRVLIGIAAVGVVVVAIAALLASGAIGPSWWTSRPTRHPVGRPNRSSASPW